MAINDFIGPVRPRPISFFGDNKEIKTKAVYSFVEINPLTGAILPETIFGLDVVSSIDYNSPNSIVTYETVGGDGGYSISTGRLTQTVSLNVRFISNIRYGIGNGDVDYKTVTNDRDALNENLAKLSKLKNLRQPVYIYRLNNGSGQRFFGKYLIKNVSGGISEADKTLSVKIDLVEYKSLNVKRNLVIGNPSGIGIEADQVNTFMVSRNKILEK
jgi:hypothetical protein